MHHDPQNPPSASPPDDLLRARLQAAASGPWLATSELLGQTPTLNQVDILPHATGLPVTTPGFGDLVLVLATPGGGTIHVIVTGPLARGLVGILLHSDSDSNDPKPQTPPPAPLAPAEAGLLTGLTAVLLRDLDRDAFEIQDVAVIRDDDGPPQDLPADSALVCKLRVTCGAANGSLVLLLDATAARALRSSTLHWRPTPTEAGGSLPLVADLVLARTDIDWNHLTDAQLGDAIVFPTPAPPDNHWPIHLAVAGQLFPAILRRTETAREVEISGPPDTLGDHPPGAITAILGRVEITVGHMAQLEPGVVISLDHPVGGTVQLRAGSRPVGAGELVEVDGSLGVRLTELTL